MVALIALYRTNQHGCLYFIGAFLLFYHTETSQTICKGDLPYANKNRKSTPTPTAFMQVSTGLSSGCSGRERNGAGQAGIISAALLRFFGILRTNQALYIFTFNPKTIEILQPFRQIDYGWLDFFQSTLANTPIHYRKHTNNPIVRLQ